ncbi:MAG: dTDP-4-dehydrorhamnose 3,5-epimerase family protein [Culturomica sp.]|jgi:dTDP-4-dehydrorhamnose 3,5-epimerase|nr:dTDP-4-dehydrorhamnose 3,5-epimerase family protein [Culturomica sp.]
MDEIGKEGIIDGVILTPLKQIFNEKGDVFHAMKESEAGYKRFGEAYFSTIHPGEIKPWKMHTRMTLNLVVPVGEIKFVLYDDREQSPTRGLYNEFVLSRDHYARLTVPPRVWFAFQGLAGAPNLLLNIADMEHDPEEIVRLELNDLNYRW